MEEQHPITKNKVILSLIWKFLERVGFQGVQFLISIILARLLSPLDYGVLALLLVFIQISNVFIQNGFSTALIQKKDSDDIDFSSVFFLSLFLALLLYTLLFFVSPFISGFYKQPILKTLLRVLAITLFFGAINSVQIAFVSKTMQFKRLFFSSMGAVSVSGIIGIFLAYNGFGVWALIVQQLISASVTCFILQFTVRWYPKCVFSLSRLKNLFSFGWKLLCSALLDTLFRNVYNLIIGRIYSSEQLGIFNRGQQFPQVIATNLDGSIQSVMLPTFSKYNDNVKEVKRIMRRSISTSAYLLMPSMFGLAAIAESLIRIVLTDKWLSCVPFLRLGCISYALIPLHSTNLTGINAIGRSDIVLKLEVIKKVITVITLILTIPFGIYTMVLGQVIQSFLGTFINAYPNKKLMNYSYWEQIKDLFPSFFISLLMGIIVWLEHYINLPMGILLLLQITSGIGIYILFSIVLRVYPFLYFIAELKEVVKKK